jgi:hypothetical protein
VEVLLQLLHHDQFRGRRDAGAVADLVGTKLEDCPIVNLGQSVPVDELTVEVGQTEAFPSHELVHGRQVLEALARSAGVGVSRGLRVDFGCVVEVNALHLGFFFINNNFQSIQILKLLRL